MQKKTLLLLLMAGIFITLITVSYAAFSENMLINGEAIVRADADIRVTNLRVNNLSDGGYETYNSKYSKAATNTYVTLPNKNSSVTYDVTVTNKSSSKYYVKSINELVYDNSNIGYEIIGLDLYDLVDENSTVIFQIKLTNKTSEEQQVQLSLNYVFEEFSNYTITYNLNGGTNPEEVPTTYTVLSETITLPTPTRVYYIFAGWYEDSSFSGDPITEIPSRSTGDKNLYAKWTANYYNVKYSANGGSGAPGAQNNITWNTNVKLSSTKPTRSNYNFKGWSTSSSATSASYSAGGSYNLSSLTSRGGTVTLYAVWKSNTCYRTSSTKDWEAHYTNGVMDACYFTNRAHFNGSGNKCFDLTPCTTSASNVYITSCGVYLPGSAQGGNMSTSYTCP